MGKQVALSQGVTWVSVADLVGYSPGQGGGHGHEGTTQRPWAPPGSWGLRLGWAGHDICHHGIGQVCLLLATEMAGSRVLSCGGHFLTGCSALLSVFLFGHVTLAKVLYVHACSSSQVRTHHSSPTPVF